MTRGGSHIPVADRMVGAVLAGIGLVAFLVKMNLLELKLNFPVPAPVVHSWPFVLIAAGVLLLWWQKRGRTQADGSAENGERK